MQCAVKEAISCHQVDLKSVCCASHGRSCAQRKEPGLEAISIRSQYEEEALGTNPTTVR